MISLSGFRQYRNSLYPPKLVSKCLKPTENKIALPTAENKINKTGESKVISCSSHISSSLEEWYRTGRSVNRTAALG